MKTINWRNARKIYGKVEASMVCTHKRSFDASPGGKVCTWYEASYK